MVQKVGLEQCLHKDSAKVRYDAACKRLLAQRIFLAWIVKYSVRELSDYRIEEIAEKYILGEPEIANVSILPDETNLLMRAGVAGVEDVAVTEGTITFDIRFYVAVPSDNEKIRMILNIEAQNDFYPGYPLVKRGIYYGSRMISSQYGTEFTKSHYEEIKKVYSIWICMNPPKYRRNTITGYRFDEKNIVGNIHEPVINYDLIEVVMICLGDIESSEHSMIRLLNILLSDELDVSQKGQILEIEFQIPMTENVEKEVAQMCNLSEGIWEKGRRKGLEEGKMEGKTELLCEKIKKKLQKGKSIETIADELEESVENVQMICSTL